MSFFKRRGVFVWAGLLLVLIVVFVYRQRDQIHAFQSVLRQADMRWVLGAFAIQLALISVAGLTYRTVLSRLGHSLPWSRLVRLHLQRHVIGTVTPAGGPASIYVFVRALGRHSVPAEDALLATSLRSVAGYTAFSALLFPVVLLERPSGVLLAVAGLLAVLLAVMLTGITLLVRQSRGNGQVHHRVPGRVVDFIERVRGHNIRATDLVPPFLLMLLVNLGGAAVLYAALRAVGQHPSPFVPLAGFVIGTALVMVAPVFGGIGMVEVTMAIALQQAGVPGAAALSATILFRLTDLWLPLTLGLASQAAGRESSRLSMQPVRRVARAWSDALAPRRLTFRDAGMLAAGVVPPAVVLFAGVDLLGLRLPL